MKHLFIDVTRRNNGFQSILLRLELSELCIHLIDLTVQGLPEHMDARELKKISGAKHVISATVDEDKLKGTCLGTGRIQIRLNQGET